jgi:hypothetical protein
MNIFQIILKRVLVLESLIESYKEEISRLSRDTALFMMEISKIAEKQAKCRKNSLPKNCVHYTKNTQKITEKMSRLG